jgi:hypothetical protein
MRQAALLLALLALAPVPAAGAGGPPRLAVTGVAAQGVLRAPARLGQAAADAARELSVDVLPPSAAQERLASGEAETAACTADRACAAAAGRTLGVQYLLGGTLADTGTAWRLQLRLVDGQRGGVRGQVSVDIERSEEQAVAAVQRATRRLLQVLLVDAPGGLPPPAPSVAAAPAAIPIPSSTPPATPPSIAIPAPTPAPTPVATPTPVAAPTPVAPPTQTSIAKASPLPRFAETRENTVRLSADDGSARRRWGATLGGTGLALLAGGAAAGTLAWLSTTDSRVALAGGNTAGFAADRTRARTFGLAAAALGGAGAIATGTGAWLWLGAPDRRVSVGVDPASDAGLRLAVAF